MFKGTSEASEGGFTPKTGLAAFQVVAINPTKAEIDQFLGRDYPFEPSYEITELNGLKTRPVHIWVHSNDAKITDVLKFYVGTTTKVAQSGSTRYVNDKGQFKYAKSEEEINIKYPDFGPHRPALEGEFELYSFIQRLIRYKPSAPDAAFMTDVKELGITVEQLFAGDFKGLRNLIEYFNTNKCFIGLVLAARAKDKEVDGKTYTNYRQVILSKPDTFFTLFNGKITDYQINKLKELYDASVASGYPLSNDLFTLRIQDFNKEDCINSAPSVNVTGSGSAIANADLPF